MSARTIALEALRSSYEYATAINLEPDQWEGVAVACTNAVAALEAEIAQEVDKQNKEHSDMRSLYQRIIESCHPDDDSRAEVAYAIARHLLLDCPCAYAAPQAVNAWQPIETAPKDGTYILLGSADGSWIARNYPVYQSGYRPENPWQSMMLNHEHMGRYPKAKPTHWMPLPGAPA